MPLFLASFTQSQAFIVTRLTQVRFRKFSRFSVFEENKVRFSIFMPICCGFSVLEPPYNRPPSEIVIDKELVLLLSKVQMPNTKTIYRCRDP